MIKVSVIVPVYNTDQYLTKCLNSLCNQTLADIEIICIDDCSTDNSYVVLKEYESRFNNIKIIKHAENQGESGARNSGLAAATGEYIGFVDSDDWVDLNFYEKLYAKAKEMNADITKANLVYASADGTMQYAPGNFEIRHFMNKHAFFYDFYSAIYKNSFLQKHELKFPLGIRIGPDILFLSNAVAVCNSFTLIEEPNYYYFIQRPGSALTQNFSAQDLEAYLSVRLKILENVRVSKNYTPEIFDYIVRVHLGAFIHMARRCTTEETLRTSVHAIVAIYNEALDDDKLQPIVQENNDLFYSILKQKNEQGLYEFFVNNDNVKFS